MAVLKTSYDVIKYRLPGAPKKAKIYVVVTQVPDDMFVGILCPTRSEGCLQKVESFDQRHGEVIVTTRPTSPTPTHDTAHTQSSHTQAILLDTVKRLSRVVSEMERKYSHRIEDLEETIQVLRQENERTALDLGQLNHRVSCLERENERLWNKVFKLGGPIFPQAVVDRIISFLHEDRHTLKLCGLICKDWLYTSRRYLYNSIEFNPEASPDSFTNLLQNPLQTVTTHIQVLRINGGVTDEACVVSREWLQPVIDHFHRLTAVFRLELRNMNHLWFTTISKSWGNFWAPSAFLERITDLDIEDPLGLFDDITQLSDLFPSLVKLTCRRLVDPQNNRRVINFATKAPPKLLSSLVLTRGEHATCAHYQPWIWFTLNDTRSLRNLEIDVICARDFPSIAGCFQSIGKGLQRLVIGFLDMESIGLSLDSVPGSFIDLFTGQFCRHRVLARCESLTELQIRPQSKLANGHSLNEIHGVINILGTMPSRSSLSRIALPLEADCLTDTSIQPDRGNPVEFAALDRLLTGTRFMKLRQVVITSGTDGKGIDSVVGLLPNSAQQGMLSFSYTTHV
ncbi:hypothetical protein VNI00_012581 [Paramarasmius palmivorus]|uniref:F-box domain-containing protein n=1 Tax=Paramarasmius palmivorus TaxID=297713 RepID=A0AAW0C5W0_9AGAR